jgi:hypothetical protein
MGARGGIRRANERDGEADLEWLAIVLGSESVTDKWLVMRDFLDADVAALDRISALKGWARGPWDVWAYVDALLA